MGVIIIVTNVTVSGAQAVPIQTGPPDIEDTFRHGSGDSYKSCTPLVLRRYHHSYVLCYFLHNFSSSDLPYLVDFVCRTSDIARRLYGGH